MAVPNIRYGLILFLFLLGSYLFCRGFFLHRNLSTKTSNCSDINQFYNIKAQPKCWSANSRYKRVIVLVIDALKYDFTTHHDDLNAHWANKMPIFDRLRLQHSKQTFHAKFVADSPTTTLQRLTALLTGSMPTFIDAATNFYQTSLDEDNWVKQLKLNGRKVSFMGDDTWMSLLPNVFDRSRPFPSFEVHDLHTVDNGILGHIYDELKSTDVDVIIGHFLGVDHCGHWFSQNHPKMEAKLTQMNQMITNVSQQLRVGDLLVVMGDHGMTLSGDHGGDTDEETTAALFIYAPGTDSLVKSLDVGLDPEVSQIDLVPTLALLMGIPIPYSSLGLLIQPLFISNPIDGRELIPLWINVQQVQRYVNSSSHLLKLIPHKVNQLNRLWDVMSLNFNDSLSANSLHRAATNYLTSVQSIARSAFTVFNIPFMGLGVLHLFLSLTMALYCARKDSFNETSIQSEKEKSFYSWMVFALTAITCLGQFSNSFVVNEDQASLFTLQSYLLLVMASNKQWNIRLGLFIMMIVIRTISPAGWICRYEQGCVLDVASKTIKLPAVAAFATTTFSIIFSHIHIKRVYAKQYTRSIGAQLFPFLLYISLICMTAIWVQELHPDRLKPLLPEQAAYFPDLTAVLLISMQVCLVLHRKYSKDREKLRLNYVLLHTVCLTTFLSIYTSLQHIPILHLHALCMTVMHWWRIVPEELEGAVSIILMSNTFFATGHQNTFQQIQWKSGFIGTSPSGSVVIPGIRILLNTFSGSILTSFLLHSVLRHNLPRSSFVSIFIGRITFQCISCFVLRQHLMLWTVFATRLLFGIVEIFVVTISYTVGRIVCTNTSYWTLQQRGLLPPRTDYHRPDPASKRKPERFRH